jgi:long-chain acyl-CoA synthetase
VELIGAQLAAGWDVLLMERWSPHPVLEAVVREKVPFIGAVPTIYAILLALPDLDRYDLSSLKFVVLSGEKVSLELLQAVRAKICPNIVIGYGSTEAGAEVTFTDPSDDIASLASGYVGKSISGVQIRIVDDEGLPVPPGQVGEVLVAGPLTIRSYFRMPEEDERGFTPDGFCRTGDLGYMSEAGGLFLKGRKKHIIRVGSYTVVPSEVEGVVLQHPHVAAAAAVGAPDDIFGEVVWLFVAPKPDTAPTEAEIVDLCRRELADFKVPRKVLMRESLATSRVGKVNRARLQQDVLDLLKDRHK